MEIKKEFEKKLEHMFHCYLKCIRSSSLAKNYALKKNMINYSNQYTYLEHVLFKDAIIELNKIIKPKERYSLESLINIAFHNEHYKNIIKKQDIEEKYFLWKNKFAYIINEIITLRDKEYAHYHYYYKVDIPTVLTYELLEELLKGIGYIISDFYFELGYERIPFPNKFLEDIELDKKMIFNNLNNKIMNEISILIIYAIIILIALYIIIYKAVKNAIINASTYINSNSSIKTTSNNNDIVNEEKTKDIKYVQYKTEYGLIEIEPTANRIGKKAYLDGKLAPDGKYKLGFLDSIIVKNGYITKA